MNYKLACFLCMGVIAGLLQRSKNGIMVLRRSFGSKRVIKWPRYSPPTSVEVKNAWSYTSTTPARLHCVQENNFALEDPCCHPYG